MRVSLKADDCIVDVWLELMQKKSRDRMNARVAVNTDVNVNLVIE